MLKLRCVEDTKKDHRHLWYRIPEREGQTVKVTLPAGTAITFERVIVRCGYFWDYRDCPWSVANELALEIMAKRLHMKPEECHRIVHAMDHGGREFSTPKWNPHNPHTPLQALRYKARRDWVGMQPAHIQNGTETPFDLRTFWYLDLSGVLAGPPPWERTIQDRTMRMIGSPGVEYDGDGYRKWAVGTVFYEAGRQMLYKIKPFLSYPTNRWYVHPLDAKKIG